MNKRAAALLFFVLPACGGGLASAEADFKRGRVAEAKETLVAMEPDARTWTGKRRTEYALYRGLVSRSLGDHDEATRWLREAKAGEADLSEDDRTRLRLALE